MPRLVPARVASLLLVAVALLGMPRSASAQGPDPFPAPLSSADLAGWCDWLQLSGPQKDAAAAAFERYLATAQALRDAECAAYRDLASGTLGQRRSLEELEQLSKRAKAVAGRIEANEQRLFDELSSVAPEPMRPTVEFLRRQAARRRAVATADAMRRGGLQPDLFQLMEQSETLPREKRAEMLALLGPYEQKLTDELEAMADFNLQAGIIQRKASDAANGGERPQPGDREAMTRAMKARQEAMAPLAARKNTVATLHRKALATAATAMPPAEWSKLHSRFVAAHYPQLVLGSSSLDSAIREARALAKEGKLPPEALARAEQIVEAWRTADQAVESEMMDAADAKRRSSTGPVSFTGDGAIMIGGQSDDMAPLRERRQKLAESARAELEAAHPALAQARKDREGGAAAGPAVAVAGEEIRTSAVMVLTTDGGPEGMVFEAEGFEFLGGDQGGSVKPIDSALFETILGRAGVQGDATDVARSAFAGYAEAAEAARRETVGAVPAPAPAEVHEGEMTISFDGGSPENRAAMASARREFAARLAKEEEALFEAIGAVVPTAAQPAVARERDARVRELLRQQADLPVLGAIRPAGRFERVDLPSLVDGLDLPPAAKSSAAPILNQHAERLTTDLRSLVAATTRMQDMEMRQMEVVNQTGPGGSRVERRLTLSDDDKAFQEAQRALSNAQAAVISEVRRTLEELRAALPPDSMRRVKRAAFAAALPSVMRDERSAESRLEAALTLASLTDTQRVAVGELLNAHRDAVDVLVDRFVADAETKADALTQSEEFDFRRMRNSDAIQKSLRFDRSEVNDASMRRLRRILDAAQNAQVEDLPATQRPREPAAFFADFG